MWKIGTVVSVTEGWGFNITDERDRPLVAFGYETHGEAEVAARHVAPASLTHFLVKLAFARR